MLCVYSLNFQQNSTKLTELDAEDLPKISRLDEWIAQ